MSTPIPKWLAEEIQDRAFGISDEGVAEVVELVRKWMTAGDQPFRGRERLSLAPYDCDRRTAIAYLQRADAHRDLDIVWIRKLSRESRLGFIARILKQTTQSEPTSPSKLSSRFIILPGFLAGRPESSANYDLLQIGAGLDRVDRTFLTWLAKVAVRVSADYGIKPQNALLFCLIDEGFEPKPRCTWSIERNVKSPYLDRVRIELDPSMSPAEVLDEWGRIRSQLGLQKARKQRSKTYALARWFSEISVGTDKLDWRSLLLAWDSLCWRNGQYEWGYSFGITKPSAKVVHVFRRDVKHAMESLRTGIPRDGESSVGDRQGES